MYMCTLTMFDFGMYGTCVRKKCVLVFSSLFSVSIVIEPKEDFTVGSEAEIW